MKFNLKKPLIILAVIAVCSFIIATIIIVNTGGLVNISTLNQEAVFKGAEVKRIDINTTADINIFSSYDEHVKVSLSGRYNTSIEEDIPQLVAYVDNGVLILGIKVKPSRRFFIGIREMTAELNVYIPKNTIEKININSSIGDVSVNDVSVSQFDAKTLHGKIEINYLDSNKTNIESYYGNIIITDHRGDIKICCNMGNISIDQMHLYGDVDVKNDRGEASLRISQDSSCSIYASTESGKIFLSDLNIDIANYDEKNLIGSIGMGSNRILISTSSGNIKVIGK